MQINVMALGTRANEDESSDLLSPSITTQLYYDFHILRQEVSQVRASQAANTPHHPAATQTINPPNPIYLCMYSVVSVSCLPHSVGSNRGLWIIRGHHEKVWLGTLKPHTNVTRLIKNSDLGQVANLQKRLSTCQNL